MRRRGKGKWNQEALSPSLVVGREGGGREQGGSGTNEVVVVGKGIKGSDDDEEEERGGEEESVPRGAPGIKMTITTSRPLSRAERWFGEKEEMHLSRQRPKAARWLSS